MNNEESEPIKVAHLIVRMCYLIHNQNLHNVKYQPINPMLPLSDSSSMVSLELKRGKISLFLNLKMSKFIP